ncbi:MAG: hypothetical protein WBE21_01050 [Candidatus Acidiferrales bacterium]|jgi:hypothetical protein
MKRRYKYLLLGLGGIWVVAMLFLTPKFIRLHSETNEVLGAVSDYSNNLVAQQYARAYQYSSNAFRAALPYDKFVQLYQDLQARYGALTAVKRQACEVNGRGAPLVWKAIIDEDFVYEKRTIRFEFVLHKEDGRWVVFSAEEL